MAAKRKKVNAERKVEKPKRKIGRYLLFASLCAVIGYTAKAHVFDVQRLALPEIRGLVSEFSWFKSGATSGLGRDLKDRAQFKNVVVDGDFNYTNKEHLKAQLVEQLKHNFIHLDLNDIQTMLLANEWFRHVSVSRKWPSTLHLEIEEQQPIARWGSKGFINRYGELVFSEHVSALDDLPLLSGSDERAYELAKSYLTMSQLLNGESLYITALTVTDDGDWLMELNGAFELALGRRGVSERVERFLFVYRAQLKPVKDKLLKVDMRYQSGVAVTWNIPTDADESVSQNLVSR